MGVMIHPHLSLTNPSINPTHHLFRLPCNLLHLKELPGVPMNGTEQHDRRCGTMSFEGGKDIFRVKRVLVGTWRERDEGCRWKEVVLVYLRFENVLCGWTERYISIGERHVTISDEEQGVGDADPRTISEGKGFSSHIILCRPVPSLSGR